LPRQGGRARTVGAHRPPVRFPALRHERLDDQKNRVGLEIPIHYRHRETGIQLETIIVNFWTFEDGWPVRLAEYHDVGRIQTFCATLAALTPACGAPSHA